MALESRRSPISPDEPPSLEYALATSQDYDTATSLATPAPAPLPSAHVGRLGKDQENAGSQSRQDMESSSMPPPRRSSETSETRSTRSNSSVRNANRLSLTLPIALPNSNPTRPTPSSSMPPTPSDTSTLNSPVDPNDFVIAIASQERRVLELREELFRAEGELKRLQRQYAVSESYRRRPSRRNVEPLRAMAPSVSGQSEPDDSPAAKRISELERRKAILLAQSQGTSRESRRTVITGGHTRALSLLSPTKPTNDVCVHEDQDVLRSPESYSRQPDNFAPAPLNKRATWAPRQSDQSLGVKQMANGFKQHLWTFVEDLRQAATGEDAISSTPNRNSEAVSRLNRTDSDQDTIRASTANRGRIPFPTGHERSADTPSNSTSGSFHERTQRSESRLENKTRKHFSWTPLTFENLDDEDWSNWDSPSVKSTRWSGSTVSGDIITAVPEKTDEAEATLRRKRSRSTLRSPSPRTPSNGSSKLEELPQAILNRLAPSNIKSTTSNLLKEWEKSLSPPAEAATFASSLDELRHGVL